MKESQLCTIKGQLHNARKGTELMNIRPGDIHFLLSTLSHLLQHEQPTPRAHI